MNKNGMRWITRVVLRRRMLAAVLLLLSTYLLYQAFRPSPKETRRSLSLSNTIKHKLFGAESSEEDELEHLTRQWKEPTWDVAQILRAHHSLERPPVPVFVVEEHHEVLKYWFDAVATGVIPKGSNTLVHIDGHGDSGPPRDPWQVPWFRLPANHSEVASMMQSNDVFIAGAALTGMINRYIWIWPDWDREEHKDEPDHLISDVKAGWRTYYPNNGKAFRRFCACERQHSKSSEPNSEEQEDWECWDDEPTKSELGDGPVEKGVPCQAEVTGIQENIHESLAVELLQKGGWIGKEETILLDIDEDYYGCESSVMPLLNAGLTLSQIGRLSAVFSKLMCASEVRYELVADNFFHALVQIVQDFKASVCDGSKKDCLSDFDADKALIQLIPTISRTFEKAGIEKLACDRDGSKLMLQVMLRSLYKLSSKELEALKHVGVCMVTAPTTFQFQPDNLHVCHGFNVPGDMAVSVHTPTDAENQMRTALLKKTLTLLPRQPSLVTVCRSMRDGYTPWAFFDSIERGVFDTLKAVFEDVTDQSFHFDENLLGGRQGWPSRRGEKRHEA